MAWQGEQVKFSSGIGWALQSLTLRPRAGVTAEIEFRHSDGRGLQLTLAGVRTVRSLLELLEGIDDFEILRREDTTPYAEFARFVCRFYRDDDRYETVIDAFEIEDAEPEPAASPNGGPAERPGNPGVMDGPPSVS